LVLQGSGNLLYDKNIHGCLITVVIPVSPIREEAQLRMRENNQGIKKWNRFVFKNAIRIMAFFLAVISIVAIIIYSYMSHSIQKEFLNANSAAASLMSKVSDQFILQAQSAANSLCIDNEVQGFFDFPQDAELNTETIQSLRTKVRAYTQSMQYVDSVSLVCGSRILTSYSMENYNDNKNDIMNGMLNDKAAQLTVMLRTVGQLKKPVITIIKRVNVGNNRGAVVVDLNLVIISSILGNTNEHGNRAYFLSQDLQSVYICGTKQMISAKQFYGQTKIQHNAGEKSDTILEGNSPLLYSQNPSANYPIDYGYTSSMQEYYLKMKDFKLQLVWGIILLSICAVVMAVLIGFDNFKPIRRLIMVIDTPEQWNDPKKLRLTDSNEIQYLATKIMSLISGNQALEGELKSQLKLLTHTKILMMQMQINPHFLFNTFNALGMMAAEDCGIDHVLTRSIVKMANILRYALEAGELMPMHQEITHAREFIDIMELRYGEMFLVEWNISDQSENLLIPKFSLQPILENAIYHGISPNKREKGKISIQVSCDETKLKIQVEDTGVGMTEAQVTALLEHVRSEELKEEQHIGLWNVCQRARLLSSGESILNVESDLEKGTTVTLIFPKMI